MSTCFSMCKAAADAATALLNNKSHTYMHKRRIDNFHYVLGYAAGADLAKFPMPAGECITSLCIWTRPHQAAPLPPSHQATEAQKEPQNNRFVPSVSPPHLVAEVQLPEMPAWRSLCLSGKARIRVCLPLGQQRLAPDNALPLALAPSIPAGVFWASKLFVFPHVLFLPFVFWWQANGANVAQNNLSKAMCSSFAVRLHRVQALHGFLA